MEYSPMLLVMLWALTPSGDAETVAATVEELQPPAMTVHQESYFTFNHGKPFLAEQDPATGAILNLRTTPVLGTDYLYEEEEGDGIDRKDGPKVFTRNDIAAPSKDPDLHKFLNLPVHYSSAGKFPLISSSYANMKVQGHNAASYPNHRPAPSTAPTVSPSYYPLSTAPTSTTTTTTTTTTRPTTTTTTRASTTTLPPPPAYEYEYEYDYDREPEPDSSKSTSTTQSTSILDLFEKDYAFLGASEEEKNTTNKVEYVLPSTSKDKDDGMVSSNANIFIPPDYLNPNPTPHSKENKTELPQNENKTKVVTGTIETTTNPSHTSTQTPPKKVIVEAIQPEKMSTEKSILESEIRTTGLPMTEPTTKIVATTKEIIKEQIVPFFPTSPPKEKETTVANKPVEEETSESKPSTTNHTTKPTTEHTPLKPLQFHHPYLKPQDILALQNRPSERPYTTYQRPPYASANVPPEMQPPQRPAETNYYQRPATDGYRPADPTHFSHVRPPSRPPQDQLRPQPSPVKPLETKPVELKPRPEVPPTRPIMVGQPGKPVESPNRPYEGMVHKPDQSRPVMQDPQQPPSTPRPGSRPIDTRYPPPYGPLRPQEFKPEQRPLTPEYRPLPPRPDVLETRPTNIQEFNVALGSRVPEYNKNKPETPSTSSNNYQVQFTQPSKVENHFIKVTPGQENPSYSLQTSFSIGVPPAEEGTVSGGSIGQTVNQGLGGQGVGQVLFPDEEKPGRDKYPRPPWESHLKPPIVFNHLKKEPYPFKRPKPSRPDLPNILPQFRPNAKIGQAEPYLKTPYDTLRPPPLPRPQFLRGEPPEEEKPVHRRNGQTSRPSSPPKRGALRSEEEKTDPVFVVYPTNNAQDGVVVGTRGPQRPLPPDNLDIEDSFPLDSNKNFQSRVDTPILKGKPTTKPLIKNDFPYPLVKPTEMVDDKPSSTEKVTKEYTAFSPTISPTEKEHDTEINVIPYLQDYMPFATKKPSQDPPKWNVEDIKPISVTLKTQKTEETTTKIENHKTGEPPTTQEFQAPFQASLSAPSQGWSVVRPRPEPEKEEESTTLKPAEETEEKFDIQNFKPQLFGGFQPILPPLPELQDKKTIKNEEEAR